MNIYMPNDTAQALGDEADQCQSRSLFFDRFAAPDAKDENRKTWFDRVVEKKADKTHLRSWGNFLNQVGQPTNLFYAQLQARLMVNMAGGAMENAGLCLDRFGMPFIPGSAVKGCARRAALAALHDWTHGNQQPGADHPLATACTPFNHPEHMLAAVALIFGWGEQDWTGNTDKSDFTWACPHAETRRNAAQTIAQTFGWPIQDKNRETPWKDLPNFAGLISFLPAYPVDLETTAQVNGLPCKVHNPGSLELDVVTCHHQDYYSSADPNAVATDTQDPIPVIFPAVAPGHIFVFALLPMDRAHIKGAKVQIEQTQLNLRDIAKTWLAAGLSVFGLGAKTNAGYGWFSDVTQAVQALFDAERAQRQQAEAAAAAMANLTPDHVFLNELRAMNEQNLRGQINPYSTERRHWTEQNQQKQYTILYFLMKEKPDVFANDRNNPRSRIYNAINNLSEAFQGSPLFTAQP